jgi:hypothetical protein
VTTPRLIYGAFVIVSIGVSFGCAAVPPCSAPETLPASAPRQPTPPTLVLQQKVKAQEKRIHELSMQLELLKQIDQDQRKQR